MKTTTTAAIAALAAAGSVIAAPAAMASAPAPVVVVQHDKPTPPCRASQLHLHLGHKRVNTGHVTWTLTARDEGPACILPAWPVLGLEDAHGRVLHSVTADTGKADREPLLYGLTATATVSYGTDGEPGAVRASYLTTGAGRVAFPGGVALVYGGQMTTTSWKV